MTKNKFIFTGLCLIAILAHSSFNQQFAPVNLEITDQNKHTLQNLNVRLGTEYENFGHLETFEGDVTEFLKSIGNDQAHAQEGARIINTMLIQALQKLQAKTAWVTLRSSLPHDLLNTPRWHTDQNCWAPFNGQLYKIVCALKGPGTLFCQPPTDMREKFNKFQGECSSRAKNAELLKDQPIFQASTAQAMLFIVGDPQSAAIHSEPPFNQDRLFIAIMPGTHEQIQEAYNLLHKTTIDLPSIK